jgi:thiamine biosynthesis lipoprotein
LTLTDVPDDIAGRLWNDVLVEFDEVDRALSGYRADSEIVALNMRAGRGGPHRAGRRLYAAASLADRAWRRTEGRFDPRVLTTLVWLGQPGILPAAVDRSTALGAPTPWLSRDPRTAMLTVTEPIDLHGIGKGLALRWAWARVAAGLPVDAGALLEAGGDLVARSPATDGADWLIAIEHPLAAGDPIAVIAVARGAVCTSSVRVARWTSGDGTPVHHLVDPAMRRPGGAGLLSVTVAGPDPAWAEIWTKDLFLCGPRRIGDRARALGLAAWWVEEDGTLNMTPFGRLVTRWP